MRDGEEQWPGEQVTITGEMEEERADKCERGKLGLNASQRERGRGMQCGFCHAPHSCLTRHVSSWPWPISMPGFGHVMKHATYRYALPQRISCVFSLSLCLTFSLFIYSYLLLFSFYFLHLQSVQC